MWFKEIIFLIFSLICVYGRIHELEITNDVRRFIALSTFGFYKGGILQVELNDFKATPDMEESMFGFSLDRTLNDAMNPYLDSHTNHCLLLEPFDKDRDAAVIYFIMDLKEMVVRVNCTKELHNLRIYKNFKSIPVMRSKRDVSKRGRGGTLLKHISDRVLFNTQQRAIRQTGSNGNQVIQNVKSDLLGGSCTQVNLPIVKKTVGIINYYNTEFVMHVATGEEEGLYNLYFHSCPNYDQNKRVAVDFTIKILENNGGNYLSAGEMPLPALYFMMALLFFLSGSFWVFILHKSRHPVFKIHYLMAVLIYLKSLSLLFHSINYHYIETKGEHVAAWAFLYYLVHLLKGAVLFITIILIGTGWTFIKHILADKDKKLFMIVIPLQVLANIAEIIIEESEEGDIEYKTWKDLFILVDLLCCGAILFPIVWSIRHLQEASHTDGKAAINLRKLKLFRHFYILIVCYIYFSRIIVYLLRITVPFQYEWLDEMFREMATFIFFVLTGYKFRPASANPYFVLGNDDDDEIDLVLTESGATEGLTKLTSRNTSNSQSQPKINKTIEEEVSNEEETHQLLNKRESSHEYD